MSLYRKYRPQTFDDLVGQEHIAQTLRNALSSTPLRVAHAYLFVGPRGTGKTTSARLLAKCLNCENGPTSVPCNNCDFCIRVRDNQPTMDLIEIDAASNTGVDNVREVIIDKVNTAPAQGRYRIYIIDEVHMLSASSFNALLKTLEEPPPHAIFILATTDAHKVPTTISSRCQRFDFRRVGPNDIVGRLQYVAKNESIQLSDGAAQLIAQQADGALRDSLTLLEQVTAFSAESISEDDVRLVLGTVSRELLLEMMGAVASRDAHAALSLVERATEDGVSFSQLTRDLTSYSRDLLLLTVGFDGNAAHSETERALRLQHAQTLGRGRITRLVEMLRATEKEMRQSTDHRLLLELALVRLCSDAAPQTANIEYSNSQNAPISTAQTLNATMQNAPAQALRPVWRQPTIEPATSQTSPPISQAVASQAEPISPPISATSSTRDSASLNDSAPLNENEVSQSASESEVSRDESSEVETSSEKSRDETSQVALQISEGDSSTTSSTRSADEAAHHESAINESAPANSMEETQAAPIASEEAPAPKAASAKKGRRIHNLEEFVELWPAILVRVKRKIGVTAVAYLHDALPAAFDEKQAVIEFKKEFHYEKAREAARRLPFEQVLNECMATPHVLKFRLAAPPKAVAKTDDVPPPNDDDDNDEDDVVRYAQDIFGASVVGRSGEG